MNAEQKQQLTDLFRRELHAARSTVRVSCAAILRVRLRDGRLVLLDTGGTELGPPGGAIAYYPAAATILAGLGWEPQRQPDERGHVDLRGFIPEASLPAFMEWLETGRGRETGEQCMRRELLEELGETSHQDLAAYVPAAVLRYIRTTVEDLAPADGQEYRQVRRFDVYELVDDGLGGLHHQLSLRAVEPGTLTIVAVTAGDIARGHIDGHRIGTQTACLLDPMPVSTDNTQGE